MSYVKNCKEVSSSYWGAEKKQRSTLLLQLTSIPLTTPTLNPRVTGGYESRKT